MSKIRSVGIAVAAATLIAQFVKPTIVKEHSMEGNFRENDYLFLSKMSYKFGSPKRGDVIVFQSELLTAEGKKKLLVKRVIALPGDTISIEDGKVFVNGKEDDQSYTKDGSTPGNVPETTIPEGKLFCMGDNRGGSRDSRDPAVGLVDEEAILGKIVFRMLPVKEFGTIENPYESNI